MREWLISIRKQMNLSQKDVAERVQISQPSYCNIENGERRPTIENAKKIAALLGFPWTRFYEDEGGETNAG